MSKNKLENIVNKIKNGIKSCISIGKIEIELKTMYNNLIKKETSKYGKFNSYDLYKNIALFAMVVDHLGYFFFYKFQLLRLIGRTTIVILAVLFGLSYKKDKKPKNRILFFAILTTIFQFVILGRNEVLPLNILYNFYFSFFIIEYLEKMYNDYFPLFVMLVIPIIPACFIFNFLIEYGVGVAFLMFCGVIFARKEKSKKDIITTSAIFIMFLVYQTLNFNFKLPYFILLSAIYFAIYTRLLNFKLETFGRKINSIFMLISRRSLEFYFLHLVLLMLIFRFVYGYFG